MAVYGDRKLRRAIEEALMVLAANKEEEWKGVCDSDKLCAGCDYELNEAVRILRNAIDLPVARTVCLLCRKWTLLYTKGGETLPENKLWRCSECDEWLGLDQYQHVLARKGDREGWNG